MPISRYQRSPTFWIRHLEAWLVVQIAVADASMFWPTELGGIGSARVWVADRTASKAPVPTDAGRIALMTSLKSILFS
jgi:hypothetical protein